MAKCYVKAFFDWIEQTAALSDAERGRLFIAILEYARSGLEPKLDGRESILFPVFRTQIDRDMENGATHAQNGSLGGRPKKQREPKETKNNQTIPNALNKEKEKEKEKDKDKDKDDISPPYGRENKTRGTRFAPPTLDEVQAYISERGSSVDAQRFIDFYASKGWMVGKNPMKDWKAAVRTWEKRDNYETAPRAGRKPERKSWAELAAEMDAEEGV